jgi:quercetin dioxygenase-like cupin family protein
LFDLRNEVAQLRDEPIWHTHGHNARTLIKQTDFRVVLISLKAGKEVHEHPTDEPLALQPLRGQMRVQLPSEVIQLGPEQLLSIDQRMQFSAEAIEDCDFLLWIGWSKG